MSDVRIKNVHEISNFSVFVFPDNFLFIYYYLVVYKRRILYQAQSNVVIHFIVAFVPEKKSQMERMIKMNW